ncbi:MAG: hypothetical protein ACR2PZ_06690 [Pseudomonadales bacterium]
MPNGLNSQGIELIISAKYVSVSEFDDQYYHVSFDTEDPGADIDLSAPLKPYLIVQRQFEDYDGGVCYIETHEPDKYAGHFRLRLIEFTPTRLLFEIDRASNKTVDVRFAIDQAQFREVQRIVAEIFGVGFTPS